jgi:hypothetical protein
MVMFANRPPYVVYIRESVVRHPSLVVSFAPYDNRPRQSTSQIAIPVHPNSGEVGG